jgi:type IV secretory pathway VirB10-like protein
MTRATAVLLLALAAVGCGDPYAQPDHQPPPQPPPGEQPARKLPSRAEHVDPEELAATPEDAARRAAELTTNWTGGSAARQYRELARVTIGDARRQALEAAARLQTDPQLAAPGARSTATVEAVANRHPSDARRELLVVTRERVSADGLDETRWRVTLATAERRSGGWALSRWEPQP